MKAKAPFKFVSLRQISGIELIAGRPRSLSDLSQDELIELARCFEATPFTFQRYRGTSRLRVWEALALHHFLDPGILGLNRRGRLGELQKIKWFLLPPPIPRIWNFLNDVPIMLKDISEGKLDCVKAPGDLLQCFTCPEQFKLYAIFKRLSRYPDTLVQNYSPCDSKPKPKVLSDLEDGFKLWEAFDPSDPSTQPDLVSFYRDRGYTPHLSRSMATQCRPADAPKGRPPKRRNLIPYSCLNLPKKKS